MKDWKEAVKKGEIKGSETDREKKAMREKLKAPASLIQSELAAVHFGGLSCLGFSIRFHCTARKRHCR